MPFAFKASGLALGVFATILTAIICTHCSYVLVSCLETVQCAVQFRRTNTWIVFFFLSFLQVKCAHTLYIRTRRTEMNFAEVAEVAFSNGPKWGRKFARVAKVSILQCLFWTYFGTCSVYTVIIAKNFQQIAEHYSGETISIRVCIAALLIPLILLSWVPNLKYLAPVSMIANLFMAVGLGITFYYLVFDLPDLSERPMVGNLIEFPVFFSITIFAMEVRIYSI